MCFGPRFAAAMFLMNGSLNCLIKKRLANSSSCAVHNASLGLDANIGMLFRRRNCNEQPRVCHCMVGKRDLRAPTKSF